MIESQMVRPSAGSTALFVAIVIAIVLSLAFGAARAGRKLGEPAATSRRWLFGTLGATAVWLAVTAAASESNLLRLQIVPPPLVLFMLASVGVAACAAFSRFGTRLIEGLPVAALVGFQVFRLPLELVLHRWYEEGVLPVQMTYVGQNFDIISGGTALVLSIWLALRSAPPSRALVVAWNVLGMLLLLNVMTIAVLSSPLPIRTFTTGVPVVLALYVPYGWIVPICVGGALFGHLLVFRWALRAAHGSRAVARAPLDARA